MVPRAMNFCRQARWLWLALVLAGCAPHFERPVISVGAIDLQKGSSFLQQTFLVRFHIQNPNSRALPVNGLHAELSVEGERVASGVTSQAFVVPAHGETDFDMTINANMAVALLKLAGNPHADAINYQVTGSANLDLPFLHDLPFQQAGTFSLHSGS